MVTYSYEKRYMEDVEQKSAELVTDEKVEESSNVEMTSNPQAKETKQHSKSSTSSTEQDLDVFLLGGDSDEGPGTIFLSFCSFFLS